MQSAALVELAGLSTATSLGEGAASGRGQCGHRGKKGRRTAALATLFAGVLWWSIAESNR